VSDGVRSKEYWREALRADHHHTLPLFHPSTTPPLHHSPVRFAIAQLAGIPHDDSVVEKPGEKFSCSLRFERKLYKQGIELIAGIDEAGRGPLAGPVVAAAVMLPLEFRLRGLNDSKQLSATARESYYESLVSNPEIIFAIGLASVAEIDRMNILRATHLAMQRALTGLVALPEHLLIDGLPVPALTLPQTAIVDGDARSFSIAAASVIAKVTRDRMMMSWDEEFPVYEFARNKGYGTQGHLEKLRSHGPCQLHRRSFGPVAQTYFSF
jgi:ribonuclease HII